MTDYDIIGALAELDALSQAEYGMSVVDVVDHPDRLRRLTGIMIKKPFGCPRQIGDHGTVTGARRYWVWNTERLAAPSDPLSPEYRMLDQLREHGGLGRGPVGFEALVGQAETERGLFKITAAWLHGKLQGKEPKSLREYYGAEESKKTTAVLDLADMLANFALTPVYVALFPAGGFVVPILLLAAKHGYAAMFDSDNLPDGKN